MKTIKIIALMVLSLVFIGAGLFWQRYPNEEYGFSIYLPRLWHMEEGRYGTVIMAQSPQTNDTDKFRENISVLASYVPHDMSLVTYFEINKSQIMEVITGEKFSVKEGEISAGGNMGRFLSFSTHTPVITLRVISAVWMKGNRAYVVTCTGEDSEYFKYESTFQKALRSLRIK